MAKEIGKAIVQPIAQLFGHWNGSTSRKKQYEEELRQFNANKERLQKEGKAAEDAARVAVENARRAANEAAEADRVRAENEREASRLRIIGLEQLSRELADAEIAYSQAANHRPPVEAVHITMSAARDGAKQPEYATPAGSNTVYFVDRSIVLVQVLESAGTSGGGPRKQLRVDPVAELVLRAFPPNTHVLFLTGLLRVGKSTTAKYLMRHGCGAAVDSLRQFKAKGGDEHCTVGIYIYGRPLPLPNGEWLLLGDVMGLGAGDDHLNFALTSITVLLSSVFCLNTQKLPHNGSFQYLKRITALIREFGDARAAPLSPTAASGPAAAGAGGSAGSGAGGVPEILFRATDMTVDDIKSLPALTASQRAEIDAANKAGTLSFTSPFIRAALDSKLKDELKTAAESIDAGAAAGINAPPGAAAATPSAERGKEDDHTRKAKQSVITTFPVCRMVASRYRSSDAAFAEADENGCVSDDAKSENGKDAWHKSMKDLAVAIVEDVMRMGPHAMTNTGFSTWIRVLTRMCEWFNTNSNPGNAFLTALHLPLAAAVADEVMAAVYDPKFARCSDLKLFPNDSALAAHNTAAAAEIKTAFNAKAAARGLDSQAVSDIGSEYLVQALTLRFERYRTEWLRAERAAMQAAIAAAQSEISRLHAAELQHRESSRLLEAKAAETIARAAVAEAEMAQLRTQIATERKAAEAAAAQITVQLRAVEASLAAAEKRHIAAQAQLEAANRMPAPPPPRQSKCVIM